MRICVIGAGTYGSYIINSLQIKYPTAEITLFDVGDSSIKSEKEIGYSSHLKQAIYKGLTDGRWFGFGGASTKWGGQLLTFTSNDFKNPCPFMKDIIGLNEKHRIAMLKKFNLVNNYKEQNVADGIFSKTGVWLSYFGRDFFKYFKISKRKNVSIITHARITRFETTTDKKVTKLFYKKNGIEKEASFDFYFLTSGAFECARLLLNSKMIASDKVMFSDHLSQKVFKIKNGTKIGEEDFVFKITGTSLITKRLVGEIDGFSFYAHPVLNTDFPFFQSLKTLMFKKQFSIKALKDLFLNIPEAVAFVYSILVKRKMYVLNNEWFLYIDIENPTQKSYVKLSEVKDKFDEPGLDVYYTIGEKAEDIYLKSKQLIKQHLINSKTDFEECFESINVETSEDIYHPFKMFCNYNSIQAYFQAYENMLVVTTGILPKAGGINPTAALLPLVDEFINEYMSYKN